MKLGYKILTASAVCFLLSLGLCGWANKAGEDSFVWGSGFLFLALLLFVVGVVVGVAQAFL